MSVNPDLTSIEAIGLAVRSEEDAAKFYGHIAAMIENDAVRQKYRHLAFEEVKHRKLLVERYKEMTAGMERPPKIPGNPETAEGGAIPEDIADSMEDLLKLAIKREQEAAAFYRQASQNARDLSGKRLFDQLVEVELGHEVVLNKELEAFRKDRDGYMGIKSQEMQHVGP